MAAGPSCKKCAERFCHKLLPCFRHDDEEAEVSMFALRRARSRSSLFHSCEDLLAELPDDILCPSTAGSDASRLPASRLHEGEGAVKALQQALSELEALKLPAAAQQACSKATLHAQQLEQLLSQGHSEPPSAGVAGSGSSVQHGGSSSSSSRHAAAPRAAKASGPALDTLAPALNRFVFMVWPRINSFVDDLVRHQIEPSINESLPSLFHGGVKFTRVTLGDSSPLLGPLAVEHDEHTGAIEVHMGVDFASDLDVELHALGVPVGITRIDLKGTLVLLMAPPSTQPPFFGGLQIYFPNPPNINIHFVGAARVADLPGLRGAVRSAIDGSLANVCVLPRRIAVDMNEEDEVDIVDLTYPEPIGVLRFTLWSGSSLVAADTNLFGAATSDPYVVARLGVKTWTSPTISKTLNPVWGDGQGLTVDFPVHDNAQALTLKVYDSDFVKSDDLIGIAPSVHIQELIVAGPAARHDIMLLRAGGDAGGGTLRISASMLRLCQERPVRPFPAGCSVAHVSVKLLSLHGLPLGSEYPFRVRARVLSGCSESAIVDTTKSGVSGGISFRLSGRKPAAPKSRQAPKHANTTHFGDAAQSEAESAQAVLAEGTTQPSEPKPQKQLAEALQSICLTLSRRGQQAKDIAEILDVGLPQVQHFLLEKEHTKAAAEELKKVEKAQAERLCVQKPQFNEVLQLLVPALDEVRGVVELAVLDKRDRCLGEARVPVEDLLGAPQLSLPGPFSVLGGIGPGEVKVLGSMRLQWLA